MDLSHSVLNEIALDGLDGVTLETLWYRLHTTLPKFPLQLDDHSKAFLWANIIARLKHVEFYTLVDERQTLVEYVPEFADNGVEVYTASPTISIYPCCYVDKDSKRGSCSTFDTREDVTAQVRDEDRKVKLSYEEVTTKWSKRLVVVASQAMRERVLLQDATDPHMVKLTPEMYCLLEHIAKGRHAGVYGSDAFGFLKVMAPSKITHGLMGYLRKKLKQVGVIAQATHLLMKTSSNYVRLNHENICYLKRMITPRVTVHGTYHEKIEQFLLTQPDRKYYVADMCNEIGLERRKVQKFLKLKPQHFEVTYVKAQSQAPTSKAKEVKPDVKPDVSGSKEVSADNECSNDANTGEVLADGEVVQSTPMVKSGGKKAKVISSRAQLMVTLKHSLKEMEADCAESDSEGEETEPSTFVAEPRLRHLDTPMYAQVKEWIDKQGPEGATKTMLRDAFGLHTLQARLIMKRFHKFKSVHCFYTESKRQKVERMCSLEYASQHMHGTKQGPKAEVTNISSVNAATNKDSTPGTSAEASPSQPKAGTKPSSMSQHITSKTAERHRVVTQLALEHKLILFPDLNKMIQAAEADKYDTTIDRKTLKRICEHLHNKNEIRIFKTCIQVDTKKRDLFYICEPTMTLDNNLMKSSLESQRSDLTSTSKVVVKDIKQEGGNAESKKKLAKECELVYEQSAENQKKYGYAAKMKRIETLHKFLSYVVYNYEGCTAEEAVEEEMTIDGEVIKLKVYYKAADWRRFVAPKLLSPHEDSQGKACVMDLGMKLPLALFLVLVKIPYKVPEIIEYLDDPIKRCIPVRYLPQSMQTPLFHKKKYLSALKEIVSMVCMMGLATNISTIEGGVTFGDISVIYLHKTASFVDTSEGLITRDTPEQEIKDRTHVYHMNQGINFVDEFWMALRNVCTATPVKRPERGQPKSLDEPEMLRPELLKDRMMKETCLPKSVDQVREGFIPGNGRGAGGLHTLFHSNLNRLWHSYFEKVVPSTIKLSSLSSSKLCKDGQRQMFLANSHVAIRPTIVPINSKSQSKLDSKAKNSGKKRPAPEQNSLVKRIRFDMETNKCPESAEKIAHTAQRRKRSYEARRAKDEKDYIAEANLETQRSIFTPQEDEALMLAKIGLNILGCKEVASKPIRDFLHKHLPNISRDKSSSSCWARMNRILQFNMRERAMHLYTSIAMNDPKIAKYKDQEPAVASATFASTYSTLMDLVLRKCENAALSEVAIDLSTVSGLDYLMSRYNLIMVAETTETIRENTGHAHTHKVSPPIEVVYGAPETDLDIVKFTLTNFTLAYLLVNDKINRTFTMHKVFEQYPSSVIDSVLLDLQVNKVATLRKSSTTRTVRRFGLTYKHRLFTERLQVIARDIFDGCAQAYTELEQCTGRDLEYTDVEDWRGHLIMLLTLFPFNAIDIKFDLPEKVLDTSNVQQSDEEEEDEEDDDLGEDSKAASAKDKRCRMRFEHCQIKPCAIRACLKPANLTGVLKVTRQQDKRYARTLMSAIPYDFNSEEALDRLKAEATDSERPFFSSTYDMIQSAGLTGISLPDLFSKLTETHDCTMTSLVKLLDILLSSFLVICVGITHRVYVAHCHSRTWVVHSLRDTKGRGSGVSLNDNDKVTLKEENPSRDGSQAIPPPESTPQPSTTFHRVDIIPKPWLTTEGTVNYEMLYQILTSVVSTINKHQSLKFQSLHRLVCMVYSPVLLLDLLQILQDLGCVRCTYLTPSTNQKPSLFSKRPTYKLTNDTLGPNSIPHYTVNHEAMQRISLFMRNTSQKHGAS